MIKILYSILFFILVSNCSFNKNSKFWSDTKELKVENNLEYKEIFPSEETLKSEFNSNLQIRLAANPINSSTNNYLNNSNRLNFNGDLKKSSRHKFSKIENFGKYEPELTFSKKSLIFFDNKGSIFKLDDKSKLIWKKNYYSKSEKKLKPVLQLANNNKFLIVADSIAKYYKVNLENGNLVWSKNNLAPFNSQIKIYEDKFFIVDLSNTLRCFSLKTGDELWNIKTEDTLIRSQKKLSMVIINDNIYFNNSIGDITAVDIKKGEMIWQLPTQSNLIYESAFSLKTSDLVSDEKSLFFSNNKNQFFSVDIASGSFNWQNKISSNLRSTLIDNYIISISTDGYLIITEKKSGNILRVTDVFQNFNSKKRKKIQPVGFVVGLNNIYLTTSNGRISMIDITSGKTISTKKVDDEKISRPFIQNENLFLIKDNAIIKLN